MRSLSRIIKAAAPMLAALPSDRRLAAALAILLVTAVSAFAEDKPLPKFGDYPVKTIYKGKYASRRSSAISSATTSPPTRRRLKAASPSRASIRPAALRLDLRDAGYRQREDRQGR